MIRCNFNIIKLTFESFYFSVIIIFKFIYIMMIFYSFGLWAKAYLDVNVAGYDRPVNEDWVSASVKTMLFSEKNLSTFGVVFLW